jgi:hypothetical protein
MKGDVYIIHFSIEDFSSGKSIHRSKMVKGDEERERVLSEYMKIDEKGKIKYVPMYDHESRLWI